MIASPMSPHTTPEAPGDGGPILGERRPRLMLGIGLLLVCVVLVAIGLELWSAVSSDIHTRERVYALVP